MKAAPFRATAAGLEFGGLELRNIKDSALPSSRARRVPSR